MWESEWAPGARVFIFSPFFFFFFSLLNNFCFPMGINAVKERVVWRYILKGC